MDLTGSPAAGGGAIAEIDGLLKQAMAAIGGNRPDDARAALQGAYPLLAQATKAGQTFLSVVSLQCVMMALSTQSVDLARDFAGLVVDEIGRELQRLGALHAEQVRQGDRDAVRQTEARAYTYAVTFIPFVGRARRVNLLAAEPELASGKEVQAISFLQQRVRPHLDEAGWGSWTYEQTAAARARYWSAAALMRWANTLLENHDSGEDIEIVQEIFEGARLLIAGFPDDRITCDIWNLGGRISISLGHDHYEDAEQWFTRAADAERRLGLLSEWARDQANLGAVCIEWADWDKLSGRKPAAAERLKRAAELLEGAARVGRTLNEPEALIGTLVNLAVLCSRGERWPEAGRLFEEAWSLAPNTGSQQPLHEARIASNYGTQLFEHRQSEQARIWLERAIAASRRWQAPEPRAYLLSLGTLGDLLSREGKQEEAYPHLSAAAAELDRFRTSFRAERTSLELLKTLGWIYESLIACCAASAASYPERAAEAFETAEKTRWRILITVLRYLPLGLLQPAEEPLLEEEHELLRVGQLALRAPALAASYDATMAFRRLDGIWTDMATRHPEYVAFRRQQTITLAEARALLDDEVPMLVEYYIEAEHDAVLAFIVARDVPQPTVIRLTIRPQALTEQVNALRQETSNRPPREFDRIAGGLYNALIRPLLDHVPEGIGLCIVPHGPLHNLPFAGLHDGKRYLIERNALVIAPSASALRWWVRKDPGRPDNCLVFAATTNIVGADGPHPDLLLFESLAKRKIAPLFPSHGVVLGEEATKQRLREEIGTGQDRWSVVHIACHGIVPDAAGEPMPDSGLRSYLAMAGKPAPDKDLTAIEIMSGFRVRATLVTLSACDSGEARYGTGDEMAGLTHAFLLAGASAVLSSLHYIVQDAGVCLTETFYRSWKGGLSKIRALQRAQQVALRRRVLWFGPRRFHPQQWSAFQLYGHWR